MCCDIVYTSGTTGNPKGVMLSHDNFLWTSNVLSSTVAAQLDISNERVVSYLPLCHVASQLTDVSSNISNKSCIYFARPDALQGTLIQTLKKVRPTQFLAVPRVWEKFEEIIRNESSNRGAFARSFVNWAMRIGYRATRNQLRGKSTPFFFTLASFFIFKNVKKSLGLDRSVMNFYGAAPLKERTRRFFASLNMPLLNCYGMSETGGMHTGSLPLPHWNKIDAAGTPVIGAHLKIDKPDPKDKEGQICLKGRNVFMGYLKNEEETRRTFDSEGYIRSGDLGYLDDDGFLHITGRIKEIIITAGGENIAPLPIEDKLKELCPLLSNVMIVGDGRKFLSAILTLKVETDIETGESKDRITEETQAQLRSQGFLRKNETLGRPSELMKNARVNDYIQSKVQELNEKFSVSRAAQIRKWIIVAGDFSRKGGHLTPTMKLKRKVVSEIYRAEIEQLYTVPKL